LEDSAVVTVLRIVVSWPICGSVSVQLDVIVDIVSPSAGFAATLAARDRNTGDNDDDQQKTKSGRKSDDQPELIQFRRYVANARAPVTGVSNRHLQHKTKITLHFATATAAFHNLHVTLKLWLQF